MKSIFSYITRQQRKDGGIPAFSLDADSEIVSESDSVFATSLTLIALASFRDDADARKIAKEGIAFLMSEKGTGWTWNYWRRASAKTKDAPIPDDMDDTSAALSAISLWAPELLDGTAWARITQALIQTEAKEGGPYNTWLVSGNAPAAWRDTDPGVNLNILHFLSLHSIRLPSLMEYIESELGKREPDTKYYKSFPTLAYFLSRSYSGALRNRISARLGKARGKSGLWNTPQETALAATTLLRFGRPIRELEKAVSFLKDRAKTGDWEACPLYLEEKKPHARFMGSPALFAAFVAEAIQEFDGRKADEEKGRIEKEAAEKESTHRQAVEKALGALGECSEEMRAQGEAIADILVSHDPEHQITLLPYHTLSALGFFHPSLADDRGRRGKGCRKEGELCAELGAASLLGWIAYKIYDDILDDEGDPLLLPLANVCLRELTAIFVRAFPSYDLPLFRTIMNGIERANLWERKNCRTQTELPDYGNRSVLAEKSLGHGLGALAILLTSGRFDSGFPQIRALLSFFRHYLIARQMNDDAHDWLEDLGRGFVNSAATLALEHYRIESGEESFRMPDIGNDDEKKNLQEIFWKRTIPEYSADILAHIKKARSALECLKRDGTLRDTGYFEKLLLPLRRAAERARDQSALTEEFLKEFS